MNTQYIHPKAQELDHDDEIDLRKLLLTFRRRYPYLIAVALLVFLLGAVYTYRQIPIYQATSVLVLDSKGRTPVDFGQQDVIAQNQYLETQKQILTSRKVVSAALDKLDVPEESEIPSGLLNDLLIFLNLPELTRKPADKVERFTDKISVDAPRNTNLFKLSVSDPDPRQAALYANTLARSYIEYDMEDRKASSDDAFTWLSEQVAILRAKVTQSEMDVLKYKQEEGVTSLEQRQVNLDEKISELTETYAKTSLLRMEKETILKEVQGFSGRQFRVANIPVLLENAQVKTLKGNYNSIQLKLAELSSKFKPNHPEVVRLQDQLNHVSGEISGEIQKNIKDLEIDLRIIRTNESNIQKQLQDLKRESARLAQQAVEYGTLKRDADSNKQMYNVLLEKLKETDIGGSIVSNNIRIVDTAEAPVNPIKPRIMLNLALSLVLGIFLGILVCFAVEFFDNSIKNEHDVDLLLNLPLIGSIPKEKKGKVQISKSGELPALVNRAYQESKALLAFYKKEHMLNTLLITSSVPGEGKTTTSAALGISFANADTKVLLVDADIMKPRLSKVFLEKNNIGLSDFLLGNQEPAALIQETGITNLYILPSGLIPPNPVELFGSERMKQLVDQLKQEYDLVIFDSPPISATLGVAILSSFVDGVGVVIRAGNTPSTVIQKAIDKLRKLNTNIVGVMLTGTSKKTAEYSYYYYGGYGYGYGYGYGKDAPASSRIRPEKSEKAKAAAPATSGPEAAG
jgi:polysaccharide biosynthesis transport protein